MLADTEAEDGNALHGVFLEIGKEFDFTRDSSL